MNSRVIGKCKRLREATLAIAAEHHGKQSVQERLARQVATELVGVLEAINEGIFAYIPTVEIRAQLTRGGQLCVRERARLLMVDENEAAGIKAEIFESLAPFLRRALREEFFGSEAQINVTKGNREGDSATDPENFDAWLIQIRLDYNF